MSAWHSGGGGRRSLLLRLSPGISILVALWLTDFLVVVRPTITTLPRAASPGGVDQSARSGTLEEKQDGGNSRHPMVSENPILLNVGQGTTGTRFLTSVMRKRLNFTGTHYMGPQAARCLKGRTDDYCNQTEFFLRTAQNNIRELIQDSESKFIMDTPCPNIPKFSIQQAKDLNRGPIIMLSKRNATGWAKSRMKHPAMICANSDVLDGLDWDECFQRTKNRTVLFKEVYIRTQRAGLQRMEQAYRAHLAAWEPQAHVVLDLFASKLRWTAEDVVEGFEKCGILKEADSNNPPFGRYQLEIPQKLGCEIIKDTDGSVHVKNT